MYVCTAQQDKKSFFYNLFPVKPNEKKNVAILCLLKFLFSIAYTLLKLQKKITINVDGATESIPFFKGCIFPVTLLVVGMYTVMTRRYTQKKLFYGIIITFLFAFSLYSLVILPYRAHLLPTTTLLEEKWKDWFVVHGFIMVYRHWTKALFLWIADLFGQFFIIILFWGLANELFTRKQAKRLYHLLIIAGCLGSLIGTQIKKWLSSYLHSTQVGVNNTEAEVVANAQKIGFIIVGILLLVLVLYRWIVRQQDIMTQDTQQKSENSMPFFKSVHYILRQPYLIASTVLICSCAVTTNLLDITYEQYIKLLSNKQVIEHDRWHADQLFWVNVLCIGSLFFTQWIARRFSWKVNALLPPVVIVGTGVPFFLLSALNYHRGSLGGIDRATAYQLIAWVGYLQGILSVFMRYVFFDASKEFIFIKMSAQARKKSKAAIDVVGSRLGKGIADYAHILLFGLLSLLGAREITIEKASFPLVFVFAAFGLAWMYSVHHLAQHIEGGSSTTKRKAPQKNPD